jgi:hypothetical protein
MAEQSVVEQRPRTTEDTDPDKNPGYHSGYFDAMRGMVCEVSEQSLRDAEDPDRQWKARYRRGFFDAMRGAPNERWDEYMRNVGYEPRPKLLEEGGKG